MIGIALLRTALAIDVAELDDGDLVITEIMANPDGVCADPGAEWFEIRNLTGGPVDLSGLRIDDAQGSVTLGTVSELADEYIVLANDAADFTACYGEAPHAEYGGSIALSNSGDALYLKDGNDLLEYVDFTSWDLPTAKSLSLDDDSVHYLLNDAEDQWCEAVDALPNAHFGTPFAPNPSCDDEDTGPIDTDSTPVDTDSTPVDTAPAAEICNNLGVDDDGDGDADCADSDCFGETYCCDDDGDGFDDDACADGTDCDDTVVHVNTVDGDNVPDDCDNCTQVTNEDQADADLDGIGDACDICPTGPDGADADGDGVPNACDLCANFDDDQDADGDLVPDACDPCPSHAFEDDLDADGALTCQDCDDDDAWLNEQDEDGDQSSTCDGDCWDADATVKPGATEHADGIDEDCDGTVDEGTDAFDDDGDGFTEDGGDCDDGDAAVHPDARETCDGIDEDCDEDVDEDLTCTDDDGDGVSEDDGDCNDGDADIAPGAGEFLDNGVDDDCDGTIDDGGDFTDDDGDGVSEFEGDCDDSNDGIVPGALETDDGIDEDCDGEVDEGAEDRDRDGFTVEDGDCDDLDGWKNPGLDEMCDQIDNDCDEVVDEGCLAEESLSGSGTTAPERGCNQTGGGFGLWWLGILLVVPMLGGCNNDVSLNEVEPSLVASPLLVDFGSVRVGSSVSETVSLNAHRGDIEIENVEILSIQGTFIDTTDEAPLVVTETEEGTFTFAYAPTEEGWHRARATFVTDGDPARVEVTLRGHAANPEVRVYPLGLDLGAVEPSFLAGLGYIFVENSGDVDLEVTSVAFDGTEPFGSSEPFPVAVRSGEEANIEILYQAVHEDPVQTTARVHVDALEVAAVSVLANDCAGGDPKVWDADGDGQTSCAGDCDDDDASAYAGNPELADDVDNDCNGQIDEDTRIHDDDGDGYCEHTQACSDGTTPGDCDDSDMDTAPDQDENADGVDNDCDGTVDEGTSAYDDDGDGFTEDGGDCDDAVAEVSPARGGCP